MRTMTDQQASEFTARLANGLRDVFVREIALLVEAGLDPFDVRYHMLTAIALNAGDVIGASADTEDRMEMREWLATHGRELVQKSSEAIAKAAEEAERIDGEAEADNCSNGNGLGNGNGEHVTNSDDGGNVQ